MDLKTAVMSRVTVHNYRPEPIPDAVVQDALAAAHQAPCHKLTWPWRFTTVRPEHRGPLVKALCDSKGIPSDSPHWPKAQAKICDPAMLVVVSMRRTPDDAFREREDYAATACAIQNMMLVVHAAGYGAKWGTGGVTRHPDTYAYLGIDQAEEEIVGFVWMGVPDQAKPTARPPLEAHVREVTG